jgi:hypothetical protein
VTTADDDTTDDDDRRGTHRAAPLPLEACHPPTFAFETTR